MTRRRGFVLGAGMAALIAGGAVTVLSARPGDRRTGPPQAQADVLLDRYFSGDHAGVVRDIIASPDRAGLARDLIRRGQDWTEAAGRGDRRQRRLVAATLALEFASLNLWPEDVDPLVEWGCRLLRRDGVPDDAERAWQRASVAIFGRARDDGRLVMQTAPGVAAGQRFPSSVKRPDHVAHARARVPEEPRFRLAEAMLAAAGADTEPRRDADWVDDGLLARDSQEADRRARARRAIDLFAEVAAATPALQPEADVRAGYLRLTLHEAGAALAQFARAGGSKDPFVAYLARFLSGRALDRLGNPAEAVRMYRAALGVIPGASSAAIALSSDLFLAGQPDEAYAMTASMLAIRPPPDDPWHQFGYGDLRFVPERMAALREAIR
ncbi:MAG: hypothetical protein R2752_12850 [Vicinamibacterales bacterium]